MLSMFLCYGENKNPINLHFENMTQTWKLIMTWTSKHPRHQSKSNTFVSSQLLQCSEIKKNWHTKMSLHPHQNFRVLHKFWLKINPPKESVLIGHVKYIDMYLNWNEFWLQCYTYMYQTLVFTHVYLWEKQHLYEKKKESN